MAKTKKDELIAAALHGLADILAGAAGRAGRAAADGGIDLN